MQVPLPVGPRMEQQRAALLAEVLGGGTSACWSHPATASYLNFQFLFFCFLASLTKDTTRSVEYSWDDFLAY